MRIRRVRRTAPKPKPRPKAPVAKAKAPGKFVNPYKPKAPITLPPGTKFKPIPPGVGKGPVGGVKTRLHAPRPTIKPKIAVKPRVRRKPRTRKTVTRRGLK